MARIAAILVLGLSVLGAGAAAAEPRAGVAGPVVPHATAIMPDGSAHELQPGEDVFAHETIVTDGEGQAEVLFLDRSSLRLGPDTQMAIDDFAFAPKDGSGRIETRTLRGLVRFVGGQLSKKDGNVTVRTPVSLLGVRGGIALVDVGADGATQATFLYGDAMTVSASDGSSTRITQPGFYANISREGWLGQMGAAGVSDIGSRLARLHGSAPAGADAVAGLSLRGSSTPEVKNAIAALGKSTDLHSVVSKATTSAKTTKASKTKKK